MKHRGKIGSSWRGQTYRHGPRKHLPSRYSTFRLGPRQASGKRLVFGKVKGQRRWEVQSTLVPIRKRRRDGVVQRYRVRHSYGNTPSQLYHGTTEKGLLHSFLDPSGLKPMGGKLYLTDNKQYARLKAREQALGSPYNPVIITVPVQDAIKEDSQDYYLTTALRPRTITQSEYTTRFKYDPRRNTP